ncbi:MAG: tRNA (adenosine(37)-N6)-threonylcarbamoyltransferase complex dimerization subunit type 1 TsaB [Rickettsiales bacterium]
MLVLAFDCSSNSMSIALGKCDEKNLKIFEEKNFYGETKHSELLVSSIDEMVKNHNINYSDLNLVIATNGPSSYTAIRVALSTLKMFAISMPVECITLTSSSILAYKNRNKSNEIVTITRANGDEYYYAKYQIDNDKLVQIHQNEIQDFNFIEKNLKSDEYLCGFGNKNFEKHQFKSNQDDFIKASDLIEYGYQEYLQKNLSNDIVAKYLREPKITIKK